MMQNDIWLGQCVKLLFVSGPCLDCPSPIPALLATALFASSVYDADSFPRCPIPDRLSWSTIRLLVRTSPTLWAWWLHYADSFQKG